MKNDLPIQIFRPFCAQSFAALVLVLSFLPAGAPLAANAGDAVPFQAAGALSEEDLNDSRGGTTFNTITVSASQSMTSTSEGNKIYVNGDLTNGPINATFGGSGFGSYVLNSGNNSVINSGVSMSVLMLQQ